MLFVSNQRRSDRIHVCQACEHYLKEFRTCGPPVLGKTLEDGTKLCGCVMPVKVGLKHASCPLGKWHATVDQKTLDLIRDKVKDITLQITPTQNKELTALWNQITGVNNPVSDCSSCVRKMIEELKQIANADSEAEAKREAERLYGQMYAGTDGVPEPKTESSSVRKRVGRPPKSKGVAKKL